MKIAIIHENCDAGAVRCARDLERGLAASHEVAYFPHDGCSSADQILRELDSFRPDAINCHSFYSHLPYSFLTRVSKRYPTCFTVHDPRPIGTIEIPCWDCDRNTWCLRCPLVRERWRKLLANRYFRQRSWKRFQHLLCGRDLRVVSPSHWLRDRLEHQELRRFELKTIPYGIDLERFRPIPEGGNDSACHPIHPWSCILPLPRGPASPVSGKGCGTLQRHFSRTSFRVFRVLFWLSRARTLFPTIPGYVPSARSHRATCRYGCQRPISSSRRPWRITCHTPSWRPWVAGDR